MRKTRATKALVWAVLAFIALSAALPLTLVAAQ